MFQENCRMQLSGSEVHSEIKLDRTFHLISQNTYSRFKAKVFILNRASTLLCVQKSTYNWPHFLSISPLLSQTVWLFRISLGQNSYIGSFPKHLLNMPTTHYVRGFIPVSVPQIFLEICYVISSKQGCENVFCSGCLHSNRSDRTIWWYLLWTEVEWNKGGVKSDRVGE